MGQDTKSGGADLASEVRPNGVFWGSASHIHSRLSVVSPCPLTLEKAKRLGGRGDLGNCLSLWETAGVKALSENDTALPNITLAVDRTRQIHTIWGSCSPEVTVREEVRGTMADEPRESLEAVRLEKLERIAALGIDPWGQRFDGHQAIAAVRALPVPAAEPGSEPAGPTVRVAGRIMLRRGQGKVYFLDLRDWTERIQIFVGKKQVGDEGWSLVELLDLGDLIGVDGRLGYTKTGELTVFAEKITFLTKSLLPPPEKWHGLTDIEQRYRQRYVDLFSNPESLAVFIARSKLIASFRRTMAEKGFLEVETPTMQAIAGGAAARPFITHHNALDLDLFLRIALELHLKRLLVGGMERVFEIGRVYRNEGLSPRHNPEFTMMEAYQAYANYEVMMELTESLICGAIESIGGGFQRPWGESTIDFTPPWPRRTYAELLREFAGVDPADFRRSRPRPNRAASRRRAKTPTSSSASFLKRSSKST